MAVIADIHPCPRLLPTVCMYSIAAARGTPGMLQTAVDSNIASSSLTSTVDMEVLQYHAGQHWFNETSCTLMSVHLLKAINKALNSEQAVQAMSKVRCITVGLCNSH